MDVGDWRQIKTEIDRESLRMYIIIRCVQNSTNWISLHVGEEACLPLVLFDYHVVYFVISAQKKRTFRRERERERE